MRAIQWLKMLPHTISSLLQHASSQGSRSTVLHPLGWLVGLCASALIGAIYVHSSEWIVLVLLILLCAAVVLYLVAYCYCLFTDKDALRTERYSIQKLAIEKGIVGDSLTGVFKAESTAIIPVSHSAKADDEQ